MAKFKKSIRNRGEDIGYPEAPAGGYDYRTNQDRMIGRKEIRTEAEEMYRDLQRHDERALARTRQLEGEFYAGIDPRRRQEVADSGLVREDHNAMANLSNTPIHHEYPRAGYYASPYIDDRVRDLKGSVRRSDYGEFEGL